MRNFLGTTNTSRYWLLTVLVNRALTFLKVNEYAIPMKDVKTNKTLDLSHKNLKVEGAIIIAALLPLNE